MAIESLTPSEGTPSEGARAKSGVAVVSAVHQPSICIRCGQSKGHDGPGLVDWAECEDGSGVICPGCVVVIETNAVLLDARETDVLVSQAQDAMTP